MFKKVGMFIFTIMVYPYCSHTNTLVSTIIFWRVPQGQKAMLMIKVSFALNNEAEPDVVSRVFNLFLNNFMKFA